MDHHLLPGVLESIRTAFVHRPLVVLLLFGIVGTLGVTLFRRLLSPIFRIPGPFLNKISHIPITYQDQYSNRTLWTKQLHEQYGPVVVLSPGEVSVTSDAAIRDIYTGSTKIGLFPKGPIFAIFLHYGAKNMFSSIDAKEHGWRRRAQAQSYTQGNILAREAAIGNLWKLGGDYINVIEHEGKPGGVKADSKAIDVYTNNVYYACDGVSSQLFTRGTAALKGDQQSRRMAIGSTEPAESVNTYFRMDYKDYLLLLASVKRLILRLVKPAGGQAKSGPTRVRLGEVATNDFYGGSEMKDWGFKRFIETKQDYAEGKFTSVDAPHSARLAANVFEGQSVAMASDKLAADAASEARRTEDGQIRNYYKDQGAASECMDHLFAGMDTTGDSLSYMLYHLSLAKNKWVQDALQAELKALNLPQNHRSPLKKEQLDAIIALPVLEAVVKETLRAFPAGPTALHRSVPKGGRLLDDYFVPEDTLIAAAPLVVDHSDSVFNRSGQYDVANFHPERWLKASKEEHLEMDRRFWTFGSGGRGCIGKSLALLEIKLLLASLYSRYSSIVDDVADVKIDHDRWTCRSTFRDIAYCKEAKGVIAFAPLQTE